MITDVPSYILPSFITTLPLALLSGAGLVFHASAVNSVVPVCTKLALTNGLICTHPFVNQVFET
jgi:hypothetical protein